MAKLKARGDEPHVIYDGAAGRRMVLTTRGRLLMRHPGMSRYTVLRAFCTRAEADRLASVHMMNRGFPVA